MKKITNKMILRCLENTHDGFMITDSSGQIMYLNKAYLKLTRMEDMAKAGMNFHQFIENGYIKSVPTCLEAVSKKKTVIRIHAQHENGVFILSTSEPILENGKDVEMVITSVRDVTEFFSIRDDIEDARKLLQKMAKNEEQFEDYGIGIVAVNKEMQYLLEQAKKVAIFDIPVLIQGESGTGKEVIANYIHEHSSRSDRPFVAINCAAIPEQLLETELFGYAEGTFTGQNKNGKQGLFGVAKGGTLFLDEIGDMPIKLQAKILRVLETKTYTPVGSHQVIPTDVRIVSATNKPLNEMINDKLFREDLYYRLNVINLYIPPLRERKDDIVPLAVYFLNYFNSKYRMKKILSPLAMKYLQDYKWPGNIRELKNIMEKMMVLSESNILTIPNDIRKIFIKNDDHMENIEIIPLDVFMGRKEKDYLMHVYQTCGTTRKAARALEIDHSTFMRKMRKYGISAIKN